ncbi:hypothetical protein [Pinibacter aurantiacus]|uniref:DUF3108 domain-containing protein n=1 Tax=Pinibacter aurantiacus TaxID=2851599 RepID=A0A9E2SCT5_9BACT|nr:hypothetical protein [Pinibacter aurantiacus]MBV4357535.1 hypothetical protein [Pinibacter aurantiacus]
MRTIFIAILASLATLAKAQSPCDKVLLYDKMFFPYEEFHFKRLKRFDIHSVPDSTLFNMKNEIISLSSAYFFSELKIKEVRLYDTSYLALSDTRRLYPINDKSSNPVYTFYAMLFETKASSGTPFLFRLDILKNGKLFDESQIQFLTRGELEIIPCDQAIAAALKDSVEFKIKSVKNISLAYDQMDKMISWTIYSNEDSVGNVYVKRINAANGKPYARIVTKTITTDRVEDVKVRN